MPLNACGPMPRRRLGQRTRPLPCRSQAHNTHRSTRRRSSNAYKNDTLGPCFCINMLNKMRILPYHRQNDTPLKEVSS